MEITIDMDLRLDSTRVIASQLIDCLNGVESTIGAAALLAVVRAAVESLDGPALDIFKAELRDCGKTVGAKPRRRGTRI